ncbi:MAG: hypothetical protein JNL08_16170 [Planctomycetes bacterium]|nr:hypothetical protein [Planctomycetota bacterium]
MMLLSLSVDAPTGWFAVFGRAHPLLLHLPLGVLPAVALLEFGALLLRREPPRGAIAVLCWFGALTAAAAAASGLVLAAEDYGGDRIGQHKVFGIVFAVLALGCAIAALLPRRLPLRVGLLLANLAMVPTGHLGGSITHGEDFLFAPLRPRVAPPANGTPTPAVASEYVGTIAPFLQHYCANCHKPDKHKGGLVLTTPDAILAGGDSGAVLVPGKPDESPLLTRCELPLADEDHMPPEDKPQPTAAELAALRAWIAGGAPF